MISLCFLAFVLVLHHYFYYSLKSSFGLYFLYLCGFIFVLDLSNAQCIPAPLATPIPVSDEPLMPALSPIESQETPESPSQGPTGRVPYSVPESEDVGDCVKSTDLDSLLEKGAEESVVSYYRIKQTLAVHDGHDYVVVLTAAP